MSKPIEYYLAPGWEDVQRPRIQELFDRIAELKEQVVNLQASLSNACGEIVRLRDDINLLAPGWTKEEDWGDE